MEKEELDGQTVLDETIVSNGVSEETVNSDDTSENLEKSQLENYLDNLDKDFTDDEFDGEEAEDETEEEDDGEISFADLGLDETVLAAIEKKGFKSGSAWKEKPQCLTRPCFFRSATKSQMWYSSNFL